MRQLITGVDANGRSCVVAEHVCESPGETMGMQLTFETGRALAPRPDGFAMGRNLGVAPGTMKVMVVQWPPGEENALHHTDTIDVGTVLQGSVDLILDDGSHHLDVGDVAVVAGVDHGWLAGPAGATLSIVILGTPHPDDPDDPDTPDAES